jgi:uncharacterized membrane protein YuzA (DUF378 family)
MRFTDDGLYYWDGAQWVSALSPDGRYRWNGSSWIPVQTAYPPPGYAAQPAYAPPLTAQPPGTVRVPTSWTRPLQYTVAGVAAVYGIWYTAFPFWMDGPLSDYMRQTALRQAAANPQLYPDPSAYADTMVTVSTVAFAAVAILGVAAATLVLVGTISRWTWMYYVVLGLVGLSTIGLPFSILSALGITQPAIPSSGSFLAAQWFGLALGLASLALGVWMLVALVRRGPWAMRKALRGQ